MLAMWCGPAAPAADDSRAGAWPRKRQRDDDARAARRTRHQTNSPAVAFDDRLDVDEAETDAVTLARDEGVEDTIEQRRLHPNPIVAYLDCECGVAVLRGYPELAAGGHRFGGVQQDVEQRLPEATMIQWNQ